MEQRGAPLLAADYRDYGRQQLLREALRARPGDCRLLCSPDRRHLFIWLLRQRRLLSFPRLAADTPLPGAQLEQSWPGRDSPQLCGLLFPRSPQDWLLCLVWESGRADVWRPPRGNSDGGDGSWLRLQSLELCNSPRARVMAAAYGGGGELVWCEERAPSRPARSTGRCLYCVCRRPLRLNAGQVTLGSMKIVLHHSPLYSMFSSDDHIFMIPDSGSHHPLLIYSILEDKLTMTTPTTGLLHSKALAEADYKRMLLDYAGFLRSTAILHSVVTGDGQLLLMTAAGQICLVYEDGGVRRIFNMEKVAEAQVKMQIFGKTLACAVDTTVFLIELNTGRLLAKHKLHVDEVFFLRVLDTEDVQLLTRDGIYTMSSATGPEDNGKSEPSLLDMVYEEACKYYQRRSLSNTKLTVAELKKGGMFQAPITLSAIINHYQKNGKSKDQAPYTDLMSNMSNELQSFISLELLKTCIMTASGDEIKKYCEELVDHEVTRLLQTDMDRDGLVYINSLFTTFPKAAWMSLRNNFQFLQNGDGKLVVRATADLWKKVLSSLPTGSTDSSPNGVQPLFEVVCQSLCTFKPKWLPVFVQHAQDCSVLAWNFAAKDNTSGGTPLYKRALSVLGRRKDNTNVDLEVDILLCSGRPQAITQAIHILIELQRWSRVMEESRKFSRLSPLITKNIFITLLSEFVRHRHLDPYVTDLCEICPEEVTATDILRIVLHNLPKSPSEPRPLCCGAELLTIGLLKPLLNKVLQNQIRKDAKFPTLTFPPAAPERTNTREAPSPVQNGDEPSPTDIYSPHVL
ncbi:BLOC-2 complex member HPS6 [Anomaloglossus baeobatrachus]|uniref:BLOC-2 complex member HPS6 n=1 Tax=Anomaloglossus baeobatrachus TaxID=238106 RepID=UPI003F4FC19A